MAGESSPRKRGASKNFWKENFPKTSLFGICVIAAANGSKPAAWLAAKTPCSLQHANAFISGRAKPSARAILALLVEIVGRYR